MPTNQTIQLIHVDPSIDEGVYICKACVASYPYPLTVLPLEPDTDPLCFACGEVSALEDSAC